MGLWVIFLVASAVILADRVTKKIAIRTLPSGRGGGGVSLRLVANERPLLARASPRRTLVAWWSASVLCAAAALAFSPGLRANPLVSVGVAAALAGASCNLRDRLTRGAVIDFISIGWWPVFNLADVAIVAGAVIAASSLV